MYVKTPPNDNRHVEELLQVDVHLCALTAHILDEDGIIEVYESGEKDPDLYKMSKFVYFHMNGALGPHSGDCTSNSWSCNRCHLEDAYDEAVRIYKKFSCREEYKNKDKDHIYIDLIAIFIATEYLWELWTKSVIDDIERCDVIRKSGGEVTDSNRDLINSTTFFPDPDEGLDTRVRIFDEMENYKKTEYKKRAKKFVEYVTERPFRKAWYMNDTIP